MQNAVMLACGAVFAAGVAIGTRLQDEPKKPGKMQDGDAAMQMPKPGPEHEWLAKGVGTWKAKITKTLPDGTTKPSTGTETSRIACGGLWLVCDFTEDGTAADAHAMGPYLGHAFTGYDPDHMIFTGANCSNMAYAPSRCEGSLSADRKILTMKGTGYCPMRKREIQLTETITVVDDNHRTFSITEAGPEGKTTEMVKIDYTRQ